MQKATRWFMQAVTASDPANLYANGMQKSLGAKMFESVLGSAPLGGTWEADLEKATKAKPYDPAVEEHWSALMQQHGVENPGTAKDYYDHREGLREASKNRLPTSQTKNGFERVGDTDEKKAARAAAKAALPTGNWRAAVTHPEHGEIPVTHPEHPHFREHIYRQAMKRVGGRTNQFTADGESAEQGRKKVLAHHAARRRQSEITFSSHQQNLERGAQHYHEDTPHHVLAARKLAMHLHHVENDGPHDQHFMRQGRLSHAEASELVGHLDRHFGATNNETAHDLARHLESHLHVHEHGLRKPGSGGDWVHMPKPTASYSFDVTHARPATIKTMADAVGGAKKAHRTEHTMGLYTKLETAHQAAKMHPHDGDIERRDDD